MYNKHAKTHTRSKPPLTGGQPQPPPLASLLSSHLPPSLVSSDLPFPIHLAPFKDDERNGNGQYRQHGIDGETQAKPLRAGDTKKELHPEAGHRAKHGVDHLNDDKRKQVLLDLVAFVPFHDERTPGDDKKPEALAPVEPLDGVVFDGDREHVDLAQYVGDDDAVESGERKGGRNVNTAHL